MPDQLILSLEDLLANPSLLLETEKDSKENQGSCSNIYEQFVMSCLDTSYGKTSLERSRAKRVLLSGNCSVRWMNSVMVWRGECWTRNSSEWPSDAAVSFLSEVLEPCAPQKYYLSPKACAGIIRRAETRGKSLPPLLQDALEQVIRCSTDAVAGGGGKGPLVQDDVSATLSTSNLQTIFQPLGFAYNAGGKAASCGAAEEISPTLRSSSHGEHGVCYSIAGNIINRRANNGGNGDGFNEEVSYTLNTIDRHAVCFQQNQRDEVRLMGGDGSVAGAISAAPGMKNTNYLCVADDNAKAAIDEDVCGTLKVGGSPLIVYQRSQDLCAPEILRESAPNTSKRAR